MAEHIRSITVHVEAKTNEQTRVLEFDEDDYSIDEMHFVVQEWLDRVRDRVRA